jgi:tryptophanyl-tRNA synthetase
MKYLFGIQPTGKLHIGNYLGGLRLAIEKKADKFQDEMRAEMAEMRLFMKMQQQSIDTLKVELASANLDIEQLNTNIEQLRQDNSELTYQLRRSNNAIYGHNTIDEYEAAEEKKDEDSPLK